MSVQNIKGSVSKLPVVDNTLTRSGYSADAKATGDAIAENKQRIESEVARLDSELDVERGKIDQIANNQIPQEYLEAAVDNYVKENEAGLATKDSLEAVESELKSDLSGLGNDVVSYERNTDVSFEDIELTLNDGYIGRTDLKVYTGVSEWKHAVLPKLEVCKYAITGKFIINDLVTTIVYVNKDGNKVGELDITNTTILDHYVLNFPTDAVMVYISYDTYVDTELVTVSKTYNNNSERITDLENVVGYFVEPTNQEEITFTGSVVDIATNKSTANNRYVVMTDADYVTGIGVLSKAGNSWDVKASGTVVELNPTVSNTFAIETNATANVTVTGNLYIFKTTDNDELHDFLLSVGVDFASTLYGGVIGNDLSTCKVAIRDMERSKYYGKKVVAFGDSITLQAKWFDGVADYFGSTPVNLGIGGTTVSTTSENGFCTDERIATIPTDTELLLIMGGMNDWLSNVPLGEKKVTNTDTTTVYGAVNVMIQKIMERVPNAKIVCMGCTFGVAMARPEFGNTVGIYNAEGLTSVEYGKAIAEMFALNGFDSFVIGEHCEWNYNNIATYVTNDGYYVHPNSDGGAKMAEVIERYVE